MLQITLEIENNEDEQILLPLLQRLGIRYSTLKKETPNNHDNLAYHRHIIERGVDIENFDSFLQDFNESRKDRHLPFENE